MDMYEELTKDELFIEVVGRVNRYLIILGVFFLIFFMMKTKVDIFLFLLALLSMGFAFLSHKHLAITNRLAIELRRAKTAMSDVTKDIRTMHMD